ncbi:hypothetical protein D9757_008246 [Collybiopsis confluens]|uniref:CCHC-type domain-containing protein n=1 Tax=Collybiopsis confluens TaxID=2823264 RepID=A0A8H5HBE1_9AGAR|nr:hypothetical protein D9757_008246 [Collybiopsis confluens]
MLTFTTRLALRVLQRQSSSLEFLRYGSTTPPSASKPWLTPQTTDHIASLPPVPNRPLTRPTPWLTPEEMQQYLLPLHERIPWGFITLKQVKKNRASKAPKRPNEEKPEPSQPTPGNGLLYSVSYPFRRSETALEFIEEVKKIAKDERHDPNALNFYIKYVKAPAAQPDGVKTIHQVPHVHIEVQTHQAYIPDEVAELRPDRYVLRKPLGKDIIVPGLTLRDIRFVMIVDELFRDWFNSSHTATTSASISSPQTLTEKSSDPPPSTMTDAATSPRAPSESEDQGKEEWYTTFVNVPNPKLSVESVISAIFRHRFCPCCGHPHSLNECPDRLENLPTKGICEHCKKPGHWSVDCTEGAEDENASSTSGVSETEASSAERM